MATNAGDPSGYTLYTPEMQLLAETQVTTATSKPIAYSYLWFGGQPVAVVDAAANTTRWYATDHLGTPFLLSDAAGAVAWRAEYTPYGDVFATRSGASLHQPLRLPGQVAQDGSNLYNNVFRWYRSGWGRYTQGDPIGLGDGVNIYEYAHDDPTTDADPAGLSTVIDAGAILADWLAGMGASDRMYGPADDRTQELMHAVGVLEGRRRYKAAHCKETAIPGNFGFHEFVAATYSLSATQHQVGGYTGTIMPIQNGFALFRLNNKLSRWSFAYHRSWASKSTPRGPATGGIHVSDVMTDIWQHFWWVEKLCCK